jgi:hypothetical protein
MTQPRFPSLLLLVTRQLIASGWNGMVSFRATAAAARRRIHSAWKIPFIEVIEERLLKSARYTSGNEKGAPESACIAVLKLL